MSLKYPQEWRLHHFPGQPIPMPHHHFNEEILSNVQSKPLPEQFKAISFCPITYQLIKRDQHLPQCSLLSGDSLPSALLSQRSPLSLLSSRLNSPSSLLLLMSCLTKSHLSHPGHFPPHLMLDQVNKYIIKRLQSLSEATESWGQSPLPPRGV